MKLRRAGRKVACADAAALTDYPLLYPGDQVLGHTIRGCHRAKSEAIYDSKGLLYQPASDSFSFYYGTCEIPPDADACPVPVTVVIDPPCGPTLNPAFAMESASVRGAEALVKRDGSIRIEGESIKISVHPPGTSYEERKANSVAIVEALVPANDLANALDAGTSLTVPLGASSVCQ